MKQPIEWHEECLRNRSRTAKVLETRIVGMQKDLNRMLAEIKLYTNQIQLAKEEGKDSFDSTRYGLNRVSKY